MNRVITERDVRLAAKLEDTRETIRRLWGDDYEKHIAPHRDLVRAAMLKHGAQALAVPALVQDQLTPMQLLAVIAAAVDVSEET